jgi:phage N-6-adenine-methyltransferase
MATTTTSIPSSTSTFNDGMRSSAFSDWETPPWLFGLLDSVFHFRLDAAAASDTAKCGRFFSPEDNALVQEWTPGPVFLNPPYGNQIGPFIPKAAETGSRETVVCLIPARTETSWFRIVWDQARYVVFLYRRVAFLRGGAPEKTCPRLIEYLDTARQSCPYFLHQPEK